MQPYLTYKKRGKATYMQYLNNMEDVRNFKEGDMIYCYGAGVIGRDFSKQCEEHGIEISGFIISDDQKKDMNLEKPIILLSEFMKDIRKKKIIITADLKYHLVINRNLARMECPKEIISCLTELYNFVKNVFLEDVEQRKHFSIFDYKKLAMPLRFITRRHSDINFYYGNERMVKKALKINSLSDLEAEIEHSPRGIDNLIIGYEVDKDNEYGDTIYVSSKERKKFLEKYLPNKKIISLGLYIKYADRIISDEDFDKIKKELGRVLLVFPYHSTGGFSCKFEPTLLLSEIRKHKLEFDTVIVCMYWYDITKGHEEVFLREGYRVVTAGNIFDYYFLPRLRTIIELSDMTMSNAIGTHIAFTTCFNKPHYIVHEKLCGTLSEGTEVDDGIDYLKKVEHLSIVPANIKRARLIQEEIYKTFGVYRTMVSEEQKDIVRKYYGEW